MKLDELEWRPITVGMPYIEYARIGNAIFWRTNDKYTIQRDRLSERTINVDPLTAQCILLDLLEKAKGRRENHQPDAPEAPPSQASNI